MIVMADDSEATTDVPGGEFHNVQNVVDALDYAMEVDGDFDIRLHGNFTPDEAEQISSAIDYAIGHIRTIAGDQKYIPGRVYYDMVDEFAEECAEMFTDNPDWSEGLSDTEMMLEVVMPTTIADSYEAKQFVNMWVCYHSRHADKAVLNLNLDEYSSFSTLQSDVALHATLYSVASKLQRDHGISVNL